MSADPPTSETLASPEKELLVEGPLPPLFGDRSFWGMVVTQFLGAFNDNLFKQLMLLLSITGGMGVAASSAKNPEDFQGVAMFIFSLPFVLFSGFAGFLSDRHSKRPMVILCKVAEIAVMGLGVFGFLYYDQVGLAGLFVVLFLMGTQSAFFGPGKYGILPEMLREEDLPRANGWMVMTTFLAIIFGTVAAGVLSDQLQGELWKASLVCVGIGVVGTGTSLLIRKVPAAQPHMPFQPSSLAIPSDTWKMLKADRPLVLGLLVSCMFWLVAGLAQPAVNALGKIQLALSDTWTSGMAGLIAIGIAGGAAIAGQFSHGRIEFNLVRIGSWGILAMLVLLAIPGFGDRPHLLGFYGSLPALLLLGAFTGMFVIPIQVFLQERPPKGQKGRTIAVMNLANFGAILLSAVIYQSFEWLLDAAGLPRSTTFLLMAFFMLPVVLWFRPRHLGLKE